MISGKHSTWVRHYWYDRSFIPWLIEHHGRVIMTYDSKFEGINLKTNLEWLMAIDLHTKNNHRLNRFNKVDRSLYYLRTDDEELFIYAKLKWGV